MIKDLETVFGTEGTTKLRNSKVLMVGSGGIGCELLKNLVLLGYQEIHVVDMDTIDLSNLNRQFLFRFKDIKKFKSEVACDAVTEFKFTNFETKLVSYTENIMNFSMFDVKWFSQFDVIMNALDNLEARRYINKICQYIKKPLFETGTSGFDGFAMPMLSKVTECFDCTSKETPVTYPVCTIRSTPSQPVHCVVWAKSFLFQELLGETQENTTQEQDYGTEDEEEIQRIKNQQNELNELVELVKDNENNKLDEIVEKIVTKIFVEDTKKLLNIETLWKTRTPPKIIDLKNIDFSIVEMEKLDMNQEWSLNDTIHQFVVAAKTLIKRQRASGNAGLEFDKDDLDALLFLATAANIRSEIFSINTKTVFDIKQIAGNIIPAIATTNAIIASFSTLNSLKLLAFGDEITSLKSTFTSWATGTSNKKYMNMIRLNKPNPECSVCSKSNNLLLSVGSEITLQQVLTFFKTKFDDQFPEDVTIMNLNNSSIIYDFDFEDFLEKPLTDIIKNDSNNADFLLILDEDDDDDESVCKPIQILINWLEAPQELTLSTNITYLEKYKKEKVIEKEEIDPKRILAPMESAAPAKEEDIKVNEDGEIVLTDSDEELEPVRKKQKVNPVEDSHVEILSD